MKHGKGKEEGAVKKSGKKPRKRSWVVRLAGWSLLVFLVIGLAAGGWAANKGWAMYQATDISKLDTDPPRSTIIYDKNGGIMSELTSSRMEYIPVSHFPRTMKDAIVAVEDSRFYEHHGLDFQGLSRALYTNLRNGGVVQGGSTITQQLAKTMLLSPEQTLQRKISEAAAALKIEQTYSKDQIMEMYLNHIYFGQGAWGLQRAAQVYFGKNAEELTLAESALLAGLPKAPNSYSPVANPQKAKDRRNLVLSLMAQQGRITAEERDKAQAEEIRLAEKSSLAESNKYPSYVDHVISEAVNKYKMDEQEVLSAGLRIYTNLDPKVQEAAEAVYNDPSFFPEDKGGLQSAIVLLDAKTGGIRGLVGARGTGSREYRSFNYATQNERQPGSAIKPIVVYAPALQAGFKPQDLINDVETDFGNYKPNNYGEKFHGWVTVEEALAQSYNVPAVALMKEVGIAKAMDFGRKAGLPILDKDRVFGLALGGMTRGTNPLAMAQAYTMFANEGKLSQAYAITKITDSHDKVLHEAKPVVKELLDANTAFTMTAMMERVVQEGTGTNAKMDRPVAGKTGTVQLPNVAEFRNKNGEVLDGSKDAWFVGYTPDLVAAVWLGYPNTNKEHYLTTTGGKLPAALFREVMTRALKDEPVTAFRQPDGYAVAGGEIKRINAEAGTQFADAGESYNEPRDKPPAVKTASAGRERQGISRRRRSPYPWKRKPRSRRPRRRMCRLPAAGKGSRGRRYRRNPGRRKRHDGG
ncbi:PBP1A family penicillin-binding protein [Paenibacillus sp. CC-CFT747]|nr:PBP1A family penicillin-binding protein [Paenibacillus sp. CC-CFT747]